MFAGLQGDALGRGNLQVLMNLAVDAHEDQGRQQVIGNSRYTGLIHLESQIDSVQSFTAADRSTSSGLGSQKSGCYQ